MTDATERARLIERADLEALWPTQNPALLKELHLLTRDGKLNQDARRKLKQIYHFARLLLPTLEKLYADGESPAIVDVGSGKSYLGFLLYDLWAGPLARGSIANVESRPELIARARALAAEIGFARMSFVESAIRDADPGPVDLLVALHACDTATDEAILLAVEKDARAIALVPCCQAEISRLLGAIPREPKHPLWRLWRHPLHSREFGSHLTNAIRALALEALGYKVIVTELLGWEHSMKNELILAEKKPVARNPGPAPDPAPAKEWLADLLRTIPVEPMLIRELRARGKL
jgi:hypothetical protein